MGKIKRFLTFLLVLIFSCSVMSLPANAATVEVGYKNYATCGYIAEVDYDIIAYVEYDYCGVDNDTEYDYVLDIASMSTYVTNRGCTLSGTSYLAECNMNYASTLGSFRYTMEEIAQGEVYCYTSVDWDVYSAWYGRGTAYRFNQNERVLTTIGVVMGEGETAINIGFFNSLWGYDNGNVIRQTSWYA